MTLLNILFGNKKRRAVDEFLFHANQRMRLWRQHLNYVEARHSLVRFFKFDEVDNAVKDWDKLLDVLRRIEISISQDLVNIEEEKRNEKDIISDLSRLTSRDSLDDTNRLTAKAAKEYYKRENIEKVLKKLYDTLSLELQIINLIRAKPKNVRELLLQLFNLIFFQEYRLNKPFIDGHYFDTSEHADVKKVTQPILLEQEFDEEREFPEKKVVSDIARIMYNKSSTHDYRELAKLILETFYTLLSRSFIDTTSQNPIIDYIDGLVGNTRFLSNLIRKLRPGYTDVEVKRVVKAFRIAFGTELAIEFEEGLA